MLVSPGLGILLPTDRHPAVVSEILREVQGLAGNIMHDLGIAALMREHGVKQIYSRDTDFHRFPFIQRLDPVA